MLDGIDISAWQLTTPNLEGLAFIGIRATYGSSPDVRYRMHLANARTAGLVVIAYHFGTSAPSIAAQAKAFLAAAADADMFCLDLEAEKGKVPMSAAQARGFVEAVQNTGRTVGLYHSESGFPTDSLGADWDWIANWSHSPARPWTFWQYGRHRTLGVDGDLFNGDAAALARLAGRTPTPPELDPYGNPEQPGTAEYIDWMHAHGYWQGPDGWTQAPPPPPSRAGQLIALETGTQLYAHEGDTLPIGQLETRYGMTVEREDDAWTLGSIRAWVRRTDG